ncbi:unnamed protein product [Ostreobium quekettii]|uniref:60S ribosomal protein L7 n=1 Tax=Ostreobium quekettii TaxID=121088 RepID=A0A8S1IVG2_9CHLO|nr:unnamed protein product [Ostreobium quekettii]|eukprot:evm.model.scf_1547EXC.3 EVM.evm.TU.scf_1547EXC.3   scf_1547EXC:28623-31223(-)
MAPTKGKPATPAPAAKAATTIPETLLKKRKREEEWAAKRAAARLEGQKKHNDKQREVFKRAEQYVKDHRAQERDLVRLRRAAKASGGFYVEPEAKLAFVIRIKGINKMHPKTQKILQLLRLRQLYNGVFIKINKATVKMLRLAEPYIAWGYPNLKSVHELIYKRGHGKVNGQRIPLTNNDIIEKALGEKHNIICIEDLVHEIYSVGPAFKEANNFLWPFKLQCPRKGVSHKRRHFVQNGQFGNREDLVNDLIRRMN